MMAEVNLIFGWAWVMMGIFVGAVVGMFFVREEFMGGYGSWRRRMVRLGHIAFMGMAAVNIGFALTVKTYGLSDFDGVWLVSLCFLIGGIGMPLVCLLSAWKKCLRHAFCVPVVALVVGLGGLGMAFVVSTI
ncbi:hypothetical protein JD969_13320 [Planctomycetota bacterium]|nr:hypothetical protein JD969_13320 [Planctomycetota bacterium]